MIENNIGTISNENTKDILNPCSRTGFTKVLYQNWKWIEFGTLFVSCALISLNLESIILCIKAC